MTAYMLVPIGMAVALTLLGVALLIVDSVHPHDEDIVVYPEEEEA